MTQPTRHFRADMTLYGPLTDADLQLLLAQLAGAAKLAGGFVSGGWVETDAAGEDLEQGDDDERQ